MDEPNSLAHARTTDRAGQAISTDIETGKGKLTAVVTKGPAWSKQLSRLCSTRGLFSLT